MRNTKLIKKKIIIREIVNKISLKELDAISDMVKNENFESILSNLNKKIIKKYLKTAVNYKDAYIFVLLKDNIIIGYALYFKRETDIFKKFSSLKFEIITDLILRFKTLVLFNIFLAVSKLDQLINLKKKEKKNYVNLNLLALKKEYQSKGYGKFLIESSVKKIKKKDAKINKIICEAPSKRVLKFYLKNNFDIIGKKLRLFRIFYILQKRI